MPRLPFGKLFNKSTISTDENAAGDDGSYVIMAPEAKMTVGALVPDDKPEITVPDETMIVDPALLHAPRASPPPPAEMEAMELENIETLPPKKKNNKYTILVVAGIAVLAGTAATLAVIQGTRQESFNAVQAAYNNDEYGKDGRQVFAYIPREIVNRALDDYEVQGDSSTNLPYVTVNTQVDGGGKNYSIGMDLVETEQVSIGVVQHKNFYRYKGNGNVPDTFYYIECSTLSYPNNCVAYPQDVSPAGYEYNFYSDRFLKNGPLCRKDKHACQSDHDCCSDDCGTEGVCECFSARATVSVKSPNSDDIVKMPMNRLQVGDLVMVRSNKFQRVYGFSHKTDNHVAKFLQIYLEGTNDPLEMTSSHFAFVAGKKGPIPASELQVGDRLHNVVDGEKEIIKIESATHDDGLFSPLTLDGTIVVNDLLMSTYALPLCMKNVEGETPYMQFAGFQFPLTHSSIHRAIAPFRVFCEIFPSSTSCKEDNGPGQFGTFLFKDISSFFSSRHVLLQWAVLSLYIIVDLLALFIERLMLVNGAHALIFAFTFFSYKKASKHGK